MDSMVGVICSDWPHNELMFHTTSAEGDETEGGRWEGEFRGWSADCVESTDQQRI